MIKKEGQIQYSDIDSDDCRRARYRMLRQFGIIKGYIQCSDDVSLIIIIHTSFDLFSVHI